MLDEPQRAFVDGLSDEKLVVLGCKRCGAMWYEPAAQARREDHFCPRCVADIYLIGSADMPRPIVLREYDPSEE